MINILRNRTGIIELLLCALGIAIMLAIAPLAEAKNAGKKCKLDDGKEDCGSFRLTGTGDREQDRANLEQAIGRLNPDGELELIGHFNLRFCVGCLRIDKPLSISGKGDPTSEKSKENNLTIVENGVTPFLFIQDPSIRGQGFSISNIWFRGQTFSPATTLQSYDRLSYEKVKITSNSPLFLLAEQFRFAIASAPFGPFGSFTKEEIVADLERQYPGLGMLADEESYVLEGELNVRDNYVDNVTEPGIKPFFLGDDNAVGVAICSYDYVKIDGNYFSTRGELELEGCTGEDAVYEVTNNVIRVDASQSVESTVIEATNLPGGKFGHPAAIKMIGNEASYVEVSGNDIIVKGAASAVAILAGSLNPAGVNVYENNRIEMQGRKRAAFVGGFAGIQPFFPKSFLQNSSIDSNTFVGSASYGIVFADMKWSVGAEEDPDRVLINEANRNDIINNDFSDFQSEDATLYLDVNTFDNTFVGSPNGAIVDNGTGNIINVQ